MNYPEINKLWKENPIVEKGFGLAVGVTDFSESLIRKGRVILGKQVFRSGSAVGANIFESQSAESKRDFIHKLKMAAKEADETIYWLLICKYAASYPHSEQLIFNAIEVKKILSKIISTAKNNNP